MKKIISILLMCGAAAGMVSAEVTVSGALYTGFGLNIKDGTAQSRIWNNDKEKASRFDLDFVYKGETTGFSGRLRTDDLTIPEVNYAFGYITLFENLMTIKAGKSDDGIWKTKGEEEFNFTEKAVVVLEFAPLNGLNFGFSLSAGEPEKVEDYADIAEKNMAAGVAYTADIFSVQAGLKFDGNSAYAGFTLNPIDVLSFIAEASFEDMCKDAKVILVEQIDYTVTDTILASILMYQKTEKKKYSFEPSVVYGATKSVDVSLTGFYEMKDEDEWYIKPGFAYKIEATKFELFYQYDNLTKNTIQFDAAIKF